MVQQNDTALVSDDARLLLNLFIRGEGVHEAVNMLALDTASLPYHSYGRRRLAAWDRVKKALIELDDLGLINEWGEVNAVLALAMLV